MSEVLIGDALGPRAKRRVLIGSVLSALLLAALAALALRQLGANGQLAPERYTAFLDPALPGFLWRATMRLLRVAAISMVLAVVIGAFLALGRLSLNRVVRVATGVYVEFFRALPVLMLILFSRFGLPRLGLPRFDTATYLILALVAYNSAVLGEIFRAGILSLDRGQSEAAYSIGLDYWQSMRLVILPQGIRRMTPAIVSQLVVVVKDTSLGYIIGFRELLTDGEAAGELLNNRLQMYVLVALIYIAINFALSRFARYLERRQRHRYRADPIRVTGGPEDLHTAQEQVPAAAR
jgi:glutamate transport system permease protein